MSHEWNGQQVDVLKVERRGLRNRASIRLADGRTKTVRAEQVTNLDPQPTEYALRERALLQAAKDALDVTAEHIRAVTHQKGWEDDPVVFEAPVATISGLDGPGGEVTRTYTLCPDGEIRTVEQRYLYPGAPHRETLIGYWEHSEATEAGYVIRRGWYATVIAEWGFSDDGGNGK